MAGSIVENLMSLLSPQAIAPLASQLGVSGDVVQRGLQGGAASLLSGIVSKADQPGFLNQVYGLVTDPANGEGVLQNVVSNLGQLGSGMSNSPIMNLGGNFVSSVLSNPSSIVENISRATGIGAGHAGTLLSIAAPLVLGFLHKHVRDNSQSAAEMGAWLKGESGKWHGFLPVAPVTAAAVPTHTVPVTPVRPVIAAVPEPEPRKGTNWLWPLLLLALLALGLWWFFGHRPEEHHEAVTTPENVPTTTTSATAALGEFVKSKLPTGVELNVPENGIESRLVAFLQDPSKQADKTTWFNFDRILFDTDKSTLQPSSDEQIGNIVQIMKAFPNAHVKIGGYTDNTGNAAHNQELSDARAKTVMDAIVAGGIDPSRLESKGYGDQYPVGDNTTDAGRALNRRISLLVTKK